MMTTRRWPAIVFLSCCCTAVLQAQAVPLNLKLGAWEMTSVTRLSGKTVTEVDKSCLTQEDLDENDILDSDDDDCEVEVVSQSSSRVELKQTCAEPALSTSHVRLEAKTPERLFVSIDREQGDGKAHIEVNGRWLGASCKGIDE
jgi:Protein of unknown function (DUF3617)